MVYTIPIFSEEGLVITHSRSLTSGKISSQLFALALPLLLGNILQQLYNVAAAVIVGQYIGKEAFAAIGVAGTVMNLFIFVLIGGCTGVSIILASLFGSGDFHSLRKESFLAIVFGSGFTLFVSGISIALLSPLLESINTPAEIFASTRQYLLIILAGLPATFFYNLCAAALRAVGNTRYALFFLMIAVAVNVGLTFALVVPLEWGIAGAAWATVFSQGMSALLCMAYIKKKLPFLVPTREDMRYDGALLKKTLIFASLSAMHQSSLYIGKILVQGAVNLLGTASIAAYTATTRIEGLSLAFGESGSESMSVFIAQNTGAGDKKRALEGFWTGLFALVALGAAATCVLYLSAERSIALFIGAGQAAAVAEGVAYMRLVSFFYILGYTGSAFVGFFRGSGRINIPFIGTTMHLSVRVVLSYWLAPVMGLKAVALATGVGWVSIVLFQVALFSGIRRRERKLDLSGAAVQSGFAPKKL